MDEKRLQVEGLSPDMNCPAAAGEGCGVCVRHRRTPRDEASLKNLQNRLSRMIGQLSGIGRMLEENRYCGDVLTQIAAVESALQSFGHIVLREHLESCVAEDLRAGRDESLEEVMALIKKLK